MAVQCATASIVVAPSQPGKVRLPCPGSCPRIGIVPQHQPAPLDELLALAQGYAEFAMRNIGHVPPSLLANCPTGLIHFIPASLADERAKDTFANTARLICVGYEAIAAVLVLEAWIKIAKPGETLDMTEPPSEAFDRREVVVLTSETIDHGKQKLLPIIRTDAGGFFGFGEHDGLACSQIWRQRKTLDYHLAAQAVKPALFHGLAPFF
jgi:hypothetical protein